MKEKILRLLNSGNLEDLIAGIELMDAHMDYKEFLIDVDLSLNPKIDFQRPISLNGQVRLFRGKNVYWTAGSYLAVPRDREVENQWIRNFYHVPEKVIKLSTFYERENK